MVGPVVVAKTSGGLTVEDLNVLPLLKPVNDRLNRMYPTDIDRLCRGVHEKIWRNPERHTKKLTQSID